MADTATIQKVTDVFPISVYGGGDDYNLFAGVINQGIDSHLQGFTKSEFTYNQAENRLYLNFDNSELPILIRRLRELETEAAEQWADDIEEYSIGLTNPTQGGTWND